eukprot:351951-Chlamydomonas_euryale.AAC.5
MRLCIPQAYPRALARGCACAYMPMRVHQRVGSHARVRVCGEHAFADVRQPSQCSAPNAAPVCASCASCIMHHAPCTMHRAPCTKHHAPCTMHRGGGMLFAELLPLCIMHIMHIMHHAPCTMHHTPCTMHEASCTMHHAQGGGACCSRSSAFDFSEFRANTVRLVGCGVGRRDGGCLGLGIGLGGGDVKLLETGYSRWLVGRQLVHRGNPEASACPTPPTDIHTLATACPTVSIGT